MMNDKTIGAIASELMSSPDTKNLNPQDIQRAQEQEYVNNLIWCVKHAKKEIQCNDKCAESCSKRSAMEGDFFITTALKKEDLLQNVLRHYHIPTKVCPTPTYDQTLYRYNDAKGELEFIWVIPDRETCLTFKENVNNIVPEERALLQYILDFYDGTLYRKMKEFNGEQLVRGGALKDDKIWHTVNQ